MLLTRFKSWRNRYEAKRGVTVWQDISFLNHDQTNNLIGTAIKKEQPFFIGKIGVIEQLLILWSLRIPLELPMGIKWYVHFNETTPCATNAGIKPRTAKSYHEFCDVFVSALPILDLLGVFFKPGEKKLWKKYADDALVCKHLHITPFIANYPWSQELANKKLFIVSPFLDLFKQQLHKRSQIWQKLDLLPNLYLDGYQFPYLIDDNCHLNWQDIYQDVRQKMYSTDFDVALFGCGALGFPLAAEAKRLGKVGIHLGGFLQVMFGVAGARHEQHPLFRQYINNYWINPPPSHRPSNYQKIEGGCYW